MMDKRWQIRTNIDDYDYPYVDVTIEESPDILEELKFSVDRIYQKYGVPSHQLDLYHCWVDENGSMHSEYYGLVGAYLF